MSETAPFNHRCDAFAALPAALADLTRRVVRKARLWPSERRELAAELESHFREGLIELTKDGVSLEQSIGILCEDFGDPDLAARLIHRSKKRGRPMVWKILSSTALVVVLIVAAGGGYLAYLSYGSPTPSVDYLAQINEPLQKIPEADRAWPALQEALLQFRPMSGELKASKSLPRPGDLGWSSMVAWVESNRPVIPLLAVAAGKPAYGFIYDNTQTFAFMRLRAQVTGEAFEENAAQDPLAPPTLSILLPHLSDLRMAARFLALDAREHMTRGEFADAWPSLDIAHRLGALLYSGQTIIEQLVGASVIATATNEMRNTLHQMGDRLTPQQLAAVKASHLMTMPIEAIKGNFQSEKDFFFNDVVQYVFTDDGNGNGHLIPSQFAKVTAYGGAPSDGPSGFIDDASLLAMAAVHADRKDTIEKYHDLWDQMEERYSLPLYDPRRTEVDQVVETIRNDPSSGQRFALIHVLLPSLSRAHQLVREATMNELATRAIVAVLQYRADHGALPQRLGELTPNYLASLPTDEYSGMNLRYVVDGVDFKLYSVGDNLKDDGGLGEKVRDGNGKGRTGPADIVYWPPPND